MPYIASYSVKRCDKQNVKPMAACVGHKLVQTGSLRFCAGNYVGVLAHDFKPALLRQFTQIEQLGFKVLVSRAHSGIKYCSLGLTHFAFRLLRPFLIPGSSFRTRLISRSVQRRTRTPPILCSLGTDIFFAAI